MVFASQVKIYKVPQAWRAEELCIMLTKEDVLQGLVRSRDIDPVSNPELFRLARELERKEGVLLRKQKHQDQGPSSQ